MVQEPAGSGPRPESRPETLAGMSASATALQAVIDKQAITEALYRYCRGLDRGDWETVRGCYWPDAIEDHNKYQGGLEGFLSYARARVEDHQGSHFLTNILIDLVSSTRAHCESYVRSFEYLRADALPGGILDIDLAPDSYLDLEVGGRYLDVFEKRDDRWRISRRTLVIDYNTVRPSGARWEELFGELRHRGGQFPDDPLYQVFPGTGGQ